MYRSPSQLLCVGHGSKNASDPESERAKQAVLLKQREKITFAIRFKALIALDERSKSAIKSVAMKLVNLDTRILLIFKL